MPKGHFLVVPEAWIHSILYVSKTTTVKQLLAECEALKKERKQLETEVAKLRTAREADQSLINLLRRQIASLTSRIYSRGKGETVETEQLLLELQEAEKALEILEASAEAARLREEKKPQSEPKLRRRFIFPDELEEQTEVLIPDEVQANPEAYRKVGEEVTEQLEIIPMRFIRKRTIRPRFVRKDDRNVAPFCSPLPPRVLQGGLPGVNLLVQVLLAKYMDHLPLYRQEQIFLQRYGIRLSRKTMADWVRVVTEDWLGLIYESIKSDVRSSDYLHADETPVSCMDPDVRGRTRDAFLWTYLRPTGEGFYEFHNSRGNKAGAAVLSGYRGLLQCDGYAVYSSLSSKEGFLLVGCMAHVRRKFHEAFENAGEDAAAWYLLQFKALYAIERECREAGLDVLTQRKEKSAPLMAELKARLERDLGNPPLKSDATIAAVKYALGVWPALERYLHYADASIDNNIAERALRPTKLGVKNWLFVGHPQAGQRAAILYTILLNCRLHQIDPAAYLTDILLTLPKSSSNPEAIRKLQPKYWKIRQASS